MSWVQTKKRLADRKGQSAIEFIAVIVVVLFFLLFFLSIAILLVVSDYMEYATFMSARTYKSMFSTEAIQERNAQQVLNSYTGRINGIARNFQIDFLPPIDGKQEGAGVSVSYDADLFYLPPIFVGGGIPSVIRLSTETRLGRDPSYEECINYFSRFVQALGLGIDDRYVGGMDDNGC